MSERERALPIPSALNNPLVNTAVNLHRSHPGEMVLLEVAAAGALLYGHHRRKERQEKYREQAAEELKQRGWDGGMKAHEEAQQRFGMLSPPTRQDSYPPRPTSAPPPGYVPQGLQGVGAQQRDDPLAYGSSSQTQGYRGQQDDPLAYGSLPQQPYGTPPPQQQYQQPYGASAPYQQYQYPPQQEYQQPYGQPRLHQYPLQGPYTPPAYHQTYPSSNPPTFSRPN